MMYVQQCTTLSGVIVRLIYIDIWLTLYLHIVASFANIIQTEAERRRREAGVKQSMEIRI